MQGSWNNGQAYYRCTYPSEYARTNHVRHPRVVYLREAEILPELDTWLGKSLDPAPPARFNHFRAVQLAGDPVTPIYWTPTTGAHEVHGAIRDAWARQGFERGSLGYPTSDEHGGSVPGGRRSEFEHGFIDWTAQQGAMVHGPVPID